MEFVLDPVFVWTARLILAGIFAGAAVAKLRALSEFVGVVQNYRLLPANLIRPVAYTLPVLEGLIALGLLVEASRPVAAVAATGLLSVFTGAVAINILRGRREIDCGCFMSTMRQHLDWGLVGRNVVLIALALAAMPPNLPSREIGWLDVITMAAAAATLLAVYAAHARIAGLVQINTAAESPR